MKIIKKKKIRHVHGELSFINDFISRNYDNIEIIAMNFSEGYSDWQHNIYYYEKKVHISTRK